jgi:hypothetical protein
MRLARGGDVVHHKPGGGISKGELSHTEVLETGERVKTVAGQLLKKFTNLYGKGKK